MIITMLVRSTCLLAFLAHPTAASGGAGLTHEPPEALDCGTFESQLDISVQMDQWWGETAWVLEEEDEMGFWIEKASKTLDGWYSFSVDSLCLLPNTKYRWTITDLWGDGIFVIDPIEIKLNGDVIFTEPYDLWYSLFLIFITPADPDNGSVIFLTESPSSSPSSMPSTNCDTDQVLNIIVETDTWASETSWIVEKYENDVWTVVASNGLLVNGEVHTNRICLDVTSMYRFTISDSSGDGFCCGVDGAVNGYFFVTLHEDIIAEGGCFGYEVVTVFETLYAPTDLPSSTPIVSPSKSPSLFPTSSPSASPTVTVSPSVSPSASPTSSPSASPTVFSSVSPSASPTSSPSASPTVSPSKSPSLFPTSSPSASPMESPSSSPTDAPSDSPTRSPSKVPSGSPSESDAPNDFLSSTPTTSTTAEPTEFDCDTDQVLTVAVETDEYSEETSWVVEKYENDVWTEVAPTTLFTSDNLLVTSNICLDEAGVYRFSIFDSYGDGLCFGSICGFFEVRLNGNIIAEGDSFVFEDVTVFNTCVNESGVFTVQDQTTQRSATCDQLGNYLSSNPAVGGIACRKNNLGGPGAIRDFCSKTCGFFGEGVCASP